MQIGTANYNTGNKTTIAKIKDGDNIYRILPPLGSMAEKGRWNRYISVEWGYKDLKGNNRPFQDVRVVNSKSKMVEVESSAHLLREQIASQYKQVVEMYKNGKASKDDVEQMKKKSEQFNLDKKYYLNAINLKGEIVLLKIGHKAKLGVDAEIKKLRDKGVDPLSLENGRFFNINRVGTGMNTVYSVSIASETVEATMADGSKASVQKELIHKIDDSIINRLASEATDLGTLDKLYVVLTADQVKQIVEGGPAAVSAIMGDRDSKSAPAGDEDGGGEPELHTSSAPQQSAPVEQPATQSLAPAATLTSTPAPEASAAQTPAAALDKEEFLKSLGL